MSKTLKLVSADYLGSEITFNEDGWFNATKPAERYGKRPIDWIVQDSTKEYMEALAGHLNCEPESLLKTMRGKYGGTWLHPKLAVRFAQWLDVKFAVWCDIQIDNLLRGTHKHYDWQKIRHEAASSYKVMSAVLQMSRESQGKSSDPRHYMTEAKLVNWALTGEFKGLDRSALSGFELDMLARLEEQNAVLIGCGLEYATRKQALDNFAGKYRNTSMRIAA